MSPPWSPTKERASLDLAIDSPDTPLPIWTRRPRSMTSVSRASPFKILILILASALVGHLLPSVPTWLTAPSLPAFFVSPSEYWPLKPELILPSSSPAEIDRIPNIVHFVYGLRAPDEGEEAGELLPYYAYLAMRSALVNIHPEKMYFHHQYEPRGPFWELMKPHLTLVKTAVPDEIHGNKLIHFAHKADVVRLRVLEEYGGIYLDIDMFILRPFEPLMGFETVMAMEAAPEEQGRAALDPEGLCNAVILARPGNRFIERWLASYKTFNHDDWAGHSVNKPWELARQHPEEITVLDTRAMFWPLWDGGNIDYVHLQSTYDFALSGQLAYHAWESLAMGHLHALTPHSLRESETSFGRMAKVFVREEDDEAYRRWRGMKEEEKRGRKEGMKERERRAMR